MPVCGWIEVPRKYLEGRHGLADAELGVQKDCVRISAQEEEAARVAAEAEAIRAADAERRKAERLARRAEAKRQGLILTGKAKKEAERLAAMREQLLRNANLDDAGELVYLLLMCWRAPIFMSTYLQST